jgi:hypothetical protein
MSLPLQIDYRNKMEPQPRYRYARVQIDNLNSSSLTLYPTSKQEFRFKIPPMSVVNLSRCILAYEYSWPALASNYGVLHQSGSDIFSSVKFSPQSGYPIANIENCDDVINACLPYQTSLAKFLGCDESNLFYPCRQASTSNLQSVSKDGLLTGTLLSSSVDQLEQQYLKIGSSANSAITVARMIPLSNLPPSILTVDEDLAFGSDMYISFQTQNLQKVGYYTTTPATPNLSANKTSQTSNITYSNVYLYIANEENYEIINNVLGKLNSGGLKLSIPWTVSNRGTISGNSSSGSYNLSVNKGYGPYLKKLISFVQNATQQDMTSYDISNFNGAMYNGISTSLQNRPLQDFVLQPRNPYSSIAPTGVTLPSDRFGDDYRESLKYLQDSPILNYPVYSTKPIYQDTWGVKYSNSADKDSIPDYKLEDGFNLMSQGNLNYTVNIQSNAYTTSTNKCYTSGALIYVIAQTLRQLMITPLQVALN